MSARTAFHRSIRSIGRVTSTPVNLTDINKYLESSVQSLKNLEKTPEKLGEINRSLNNIAAGLEKIGSLLAHLPTGNEWIVEGHVIDENKNGIEGLTISVFDKDLFYDDRLGTAKTNKNGYFKVTYRTEDFRDLIETNPDIFITVYEGGNRVYSIETPVRWESGRREYFCIQKTRKGWFEFKKE
ncbi:MAG: hypothetical protein E3K37_00185 [Candidatus Kuenenia sp.]|nr:hypothetical protein [Candidatus Kuenenia hertensis]